MLKPWFIDPSAVDRSKWFERASKHCEFATRPSWMPHLTLLDVTLQDGAPPFVGWWLTKIIKFGGAPLWRWWDGKHWSLSYTENSQVHTQTIIGTVAADKGVMWCLYWPERARVPRLPPGWIFTAGDKLPKEALGHTAIDLVLASGVVRRGMAPKHWRSCRGVLAWGPAQ
jgi:hypothetical protein